MLVEFTWLGLLLLVPLIYLMVTVFEVQREAYAATAAASAAGRAISVAGSDEEAHRQARAAVTLAYADQGIDDPRWALEVDCSPSSCLAPGAVIEVRVSSRIDLPLLPRVFGSAQPSIPVSASHTVPRGRFRSGG